MTFDSLQVNKTNQVIKILTLVSCILLPLTFIASLYGMKVKVPIEERADSFLIISAGMLIITIGILIWFRIRRWR
jgi:magnesium transporter